MNVDIFPVPTHLLVGAEIGMGGTGMGVSRTRPLSGVSESSPLPNGRVTHPERTVLPTFLRVSPSELPLRRLDLYLPFPGERNLSTVTSSTLGRGTWDSEPVDSRC